jgi:hypothetical protein
MLNNTSSNEAYYGVPGNIRMVPNEFAVIGWRVMLLVLSRTYLFEFQNRPNRQRLMR